MQLLDNDHKVTRVCKPILCLFGSFCYVVVPCIFVIIFLFEYFNVWVINVLVFVINDGVHFDEKYWTLVKNLLSYNKRPCKVFFLIFFPIQLAKHKPLLPRLQLSRWCFIVSSSQYFYFVCSQCFLSKCNVFLDITNWHTWSFGKILHNER